MITKDRSRRLNGLSLDSGQKRTNGWSMNLGLILLVFSFVLFFIACWPAAGPYWNRLIAAGLTFFVAAELFGGVTRAFFH